MNAIAITLLVIDLSVPDELTTSTWPSTAVNDPGGATEPLPLHHYADGRTSRSPTDADPWVATFAGLSRNRP
jgi:hypothetical protein